MYQYVEMAKFLNMSYVDVKELPYDEFLELQRVMQIHNYTSTEQGHQILKDNIRYMEVSPDEPRLKEKLGQKGGK